jgi:hypothetical protein
MTTTRLLRLSLRGILAWCLVSAAGFLLARPIVAGMSPFFEGVIDAMQSDYAAQLDVVEAAEGPKISMTCTAKRQLVLARGKIVPFLASYNCARMDATHALVPVVIFLVAVIGWPIGDRRETLRRALGCVLLLPIILASTTPLLLYGLVEATLHPESFGAGAQVKALWQPFVFMEMGGSWLLPLVAAALCVGFCTRRKGRSNRLPIHADAS